MSDKPSKPKDKRESREQDKAQKQEQKTAETVHLSAEELRKISGGAGVTPPKGTKY